MKFCTQTPSYVESLVLVVSIMRARKIIFLFPNVKGTGLHQNQRIAF